MKNSEPRRIVCLVKGLIMAYVITFPAFAVFALILSYTTFPDRYLNAVVFLIIMTSVLTASSVAGRNLKNRGWLNGSIVGAFYIFVLYVISGFALNDFGIDGKLVKMAVAVILTGAIGGIIGINMKRKRIKN